MFHPYSPSLTVASSEPPPRIAPILALASKRAAVFPGDHSEVLILTDVVPLLKRHVEVLPLR